MRLIADTVAFAVNKIPRWNPTNVCSYHLQEAVQPGTGDRPRDVDRDRRPRRGEDATGGRGRTSKVFGRISFFVNAGVRFVEEHASCERWATSERLARALRGDRAEVSCACAMASRSTCSGSPRRNRRTTCSGSCSRRSPSPWGATPRTGDPAPGLERGARLPRPWDQQWSLRIQQVSAYETDLLEYPDIFEGSKVMDGLVVELVEGAEEEMRIVVLDQGGAVSTVAYMKARLVESHRERITRIEREEIKVVGQNCFTETEDSPLTAGADGGILRPDPEVERECVEALEAWKAERDQAAASMRRSSGWRRQRAMSRRTSCRRRSRRRRPERPPVNGRAPCARSSATTALRPGSRAPPRRTTSSSSRRCASGSTSLPIGRRPRTRRKAGPRRPLQRRGTDRRPRPRRRHGGHLSGSGSRPSRSPPRRSRRTSTSSGFRSSPARTWS